MANDIKVREEQLYGVAVRNISLKGQAQYIEKIENAQITNKVYEITTINNGSVITSNIIPSTTHYSLFVLENEDYSKGYFLIDKKCSLTKYMDGLRDKYGCVTNNNIGLIKKMPCIFANKNNSYKVATPDQFAFFGYIAGIEEDDTTYKIYFSTTCSIEQNKLNQHEALLGIKSKDATNELDIVHWSIKKVNIKKALKSIGIRVAAY